MVRIGAGIAALGVLLNLLPGISRTVLAMARRRELPHWFAGVPVRGIGRDGPLAGEILDLLPAFTAFRRDVPTFWPNARIWPEGALGPSFLP